MTIRDARGLELSHATAACATAHDQALALFNAYDVDPLAAIDTVLAEHPDFVAGHLLRAGLLIAGMERTLMPMVCDSVASAERLGASATDRERSLSAAFRLFAGEHFHAASQALGRHLTDWPRDLLAAQVAHLLDFYLGQSTQLRDRIARLLPHWSASDAGHGHLLGMYAFGLEECNEYARAESTGRQAVDAHARDAWAIHAVAHVCEMEGRFDDGIRWLEERRADWSTGNMLAVHNAWHLALYHLERGDTDTVLAHYDGAVRGGRSEVVLDMVDASALLWRLWLRGVDPGATRWSEIAECWGRLVDDGFYAFNDVHGVMAFVGSGDDTRARRAELQLLRAAQGTGSNAAMARDVGLPVAMALRAFADGQHALCAQILLPVLPIAHRFGGSHAQRDLLQLTALEAAMRAGDRALAAALSAQRLASRPHSPFNRTQARRAQGLPDGVQGGSSVA